MVDEAEFLQGVEQRLVVDCSERQAVYLLSGRNGSYIRLSSSAAQLLRQVGQGASFEHLAGVLSRRGSMAVLPSEVEAAYRRIIEQIKAIEAQESKPRGPFWLRREILPSSLVNRIASRCSVAFHPAAVVVLLAVILAGGLLGRWSEWHIEARCLWPAYGLFLGSLVAHEIGHASACARHGVRPREIGVALYLIYPVFYSNVSAAWTLKRWQRVSVDVAGVYFQLVVGAGYSFAYVLCGWAPLGVAVIFILGSCLFSLNPILKCDGYWVVADGLGVINLSKQPMRIVRHWVARVRGRAVPPLPWSPCVAGALALYTALSVSFWIWFLWTMAPSLLSHGMHAVEVMTSLVVQLVSTSGWPDAAQVRAGLTSISVLLLAALAGRRLLRLVLVIVKRVCAALAATWRAYRVAKHV